jgi:ABC-2 type transport system ATP-binding protein
MLCRNIGIINRGELIENTTMKSLLNKLSVETFILDLEEGVSEPTLQGVNSQVMVNGSLEIEIDKTLGLNTIFSQLTEQGIKVLSMRNKANRLEELFVSIVREGSK